MSRKWTPELDTILLQGVFEECQISFGKALCEKIAERVRAANIDGFTECNPKSIENRLYAWKKKNMPPSTGEVAPATPKKAASKQPATPKTKTPRAKKGVTKKVVESEVTPSKGQKRAAESEEGAEEKKVKIEGGNDEDVEVAEEEKEV